MNVKERTISLVQLYFKERNYRFYLAIVISSLSFLAGLIYFFCPRKEYDSIWPTALLIVGSTSFFVFSFWSPKIGAIFLTASNLFALMMHIYASYPYLFSLALKGMGINLSDSNMKLILDFGVIFFALFALANASIWLNMTKKSKGGEK